MDEPVRRIPEERDNSTVIFLSLFLLVLAFFILLTATSEVNERSSQDIIQAVKGTFGGDRSTNLPTTRERLDAEADAVAQLVAEELQALFDRDLPGARTIRAGERVLLVRFPEFELFSRERPTVRRNRLPLIREVARVIAATPTGIDHRLELSLADPVAFAGRGAAERATAVARLGHLAAAFVAEGASAEEMSVGLRPAAAVALDGADDVFMQVFTFVREADSVVRFSPARGEAGAGTGGPVLNLRLDRPGGGG